MNSNFIKLIYILDKIRNLKELFFRNGLNTNKYDVLSRALQLSLKYQKFIDKDLKLDAWNIKREHVIDTIMTYKKIVDNKIDYVGIFGDLSNNKKSFIKKELESRAYQDDSIKIIREENAIYVPISRDKLSLEILEKISRENLPVANLNNVISLMYINGKEYYLSFDSVAFIDYFYKYGNNLEEYLLSEITYFLSTEESKIIEIVCDNLDSTFIKSLIMPESSFGFNFEAKKYGLRNTENYYILLDIFRNFDFNEIKDLSFSVIKDKYYKNYEQQVIRKLK